MSLPSSRLRKATEDDAEYINHLLNHESVREWFDGGDRRKALQAYETWITEKGAFFVYRHSDNVVSFHVCCLEGCDTVKALRELSELVPHRISMCAIEDKNRKARMMAGAFGFRRVASFCGKGIYQRMK